MANPDFERGREFQRVQSALSHLAGQILTNPSEIVDDTLYLLLRAKTDRFHDLRTVNYGRVDALLQATYDVADLARKELEKRLGHSQIDRLNHIYDEKYAKK